jgi:hypothetical protein
VRGANQLRAVILRGKDLPVSHPGGSANSRGKSRSPQNSENGPLTSVAAQGIGAVSTFSGAEQARPGILNPGFAEFFENFEMAYCRNGK